MEDHDYSTPPNNADGSIITADVRLNVYKISKIDSVDGSMYVDLDNKEVNAGITATADTATSCLIN